MRRRSQMRFGDETLSRWIVGPWFPAFVNVFLALVIWVYLFVVVPADSSTIMRAVNYAIVAGLASLLVENHKCFGLTWS